MKNFQSHQTTSNSLIQRDTLSAQILSKLMDWIIEGKLKMGEKLNTEELARHLGVSRMPIREALSGLEKMGLAESIPYVGMKLITLTPDDVFQVYKMRQALEPMLIVEACKNITDEKIAELEKIHEEYVRIVKEPELDSKRLYLQNRKFHFAIYEQSGLHRICDVVESLWNTLSFFKLIYGSDIIKHKEGADRNIAEHQGHIDALKSRSHDLIGQYIYDNLQRRIDGIPKDTNYYE